MSRIALTDGSGRWFDESRSTAFEEAKLFDGNNRCSVNTKSQWSAQTLYRTAGGRWILEEASRRQGSADKHTALSNEEAAAWLVLNEHEPHEACAQEFADLEIA